MYEKSNAGILAAGENMSVPVLSSSEWISRLMDMTCDGAASVTAFYEHRMGAICKDPRLLLVPLVDHMVHRGDAVFESLSLSEGGIIQIDAHLERMKHSASVLGLTPPCSWEEIRALMIAVARAGAEPCGGLKVLLGRGCGGLGVDPAECRESSLYIVASKRKPLPELFWKKGLTSARSSIPAKQAWLAQIKSTNYLANALMAQEARSKGVDLTFSFDDRGFLAEAAIANVALVDRQGRMLMPEFRHALPGTTAILAAEAAASFMPVVRTDIDERTVENASEILVLGTTCECVAVTHYNEMPIGNGRPGPVAERLRAVLHEKLKIGAVSFL